jgi:hypothetical protein
MKLTTHLYAGAFACAAALSFAALPAWAHHSHAMFDLEAEQTIEGTVKLYLFTNPHIYLYVNVVEKEGAAPKVFLVEMSHVQNMMSRGILASTFKPGDKITLTMNPLRDGRSGGSYVSVIDARGKHYGGREEAAAALAADTGGAR